MRAGALALSAVLAGCAASGSAETSPKPKTSDPSASVEKAAASTDPVYRFNSKESPSGEGAPAGGIKGAGSGGPGGPSGGAGAPDDVLKAQKEVVARNPTNDDEKLRLAFLYATAGNLEEAERVLSSVRTRTNRLVPYLELYLRRQLGDHKEASKLLGLLTEEEKLATGFVIERAELCSTVRKYRDYTPAENDRVPPGGLALLYVEPRNFALQRHQDKYIFHVRYEWKLYDDRSIEHHVPAWEQAKPEEREDRVTLNGPASEFYQSFRLPLPLNLAMGQYRIMVTVTDALSGKSDRATIPLYVTAVERVR